MSNELVISDELYARLSKKGKYKSVKLGRSYTPEEKIEVCAHWMAGYSSRKIQEILGVPAATTRDWMREEWWKQLLKELRHAKAQELDNNLTRVIEKATKQLEERIDNGNFKHNPRTGELERVPLSSSELSRDGIGIPFDKRALTRGDPTSRQVKDEGTPEKLLEKLAEQFARIAQGKPVEATVEAVETSEGVFEVPNTTSL